MHQHSCINKCLSLLELNYLSADSAARDDASAALVDQPEADFDASAAEADALMAVDTFCLHKQQSSQCPHEMVMCTNFIPCSKLPLQVLNFICICAKSSNRMLG